MSIVHTGTMAKLPTKEHEICAEILKKMRLENDELYSIIYQVQEKVDVISKNLEKHESKFPSKQPNWIIYVPEEGYD